MNSSGWPVYVYEAAPYEHWGNYYYTVNDQVVEGLVHPNFAKIIPVNNQYYKIKITIRKGSSVGTWANLFNIINNWDHVVATYETTPSRVQLKNATPSLALTSQSGTVNNIPVSCQSNVSINGSATNCETRYLLEVIETDQWWNPLPLPDYAGAWFNVPVKLNDIDLQWFTNTYGNPLNGNVVNGPAPTAYAGFAMRERTIFNGTGNTANFYIIKLSVLENVWQSAQIFIDINGSCKTDGGAKIAFDPSAMVPMTEEEIAEMYALHGMPYTTSSSQFLNQPEDISIILAPNPAQDYVNLALSDGSSPAAIIVTDLYGQQYKCPITPQDLGNVQLNTQNLNSGLYIVSIVTNNTLVQEKLWIK